MRIAGVALAMLAGMVPASAEDDGSLVDIGGRKIFLTCAGTGSPTVILVSGYRNDAEIWTVDLRPGVTTVFDGVSRFTRVCASDRPGTILDKDHLSRSDPVPMPRTADAVVAELHDTLQAAQIPPPYVLVPHSLGGLFARLYAADYPGNVAGMVLVDTWPENLPDLVSPDVWAGYVELARAPPPGLENYGDLEQVDFAAASTRMRAALAGHPAKEMPVVVISRGKPVQLPPNVPAGFLPEAFEKAWAKGQEQLIGLVPGTRHVKAIDSDHYVQVEQPALVIDAVREVVDAVRDPALWGK